MKTFFCIHCAWFIPALIYAQAQAPDPTAIIREADSQVRGETMQGTMELKIVRPDWERTISLKSWSKGDDDFMIYITSPAKEKGQVFLKRGTEMWNWVPSIERMIKIPPSMMMQSWMGSDFTNDDLVKQSSLVKDYEHRLDGEETVRGKKCYRIVLTPKPEAPVVWGRIIAWITVEGHHFWKNEYYDEDDVLINEENAYDLKDVGDRVIPTRHEIIPVDKPGHKTVMVIGQVTYNGPIADDFFTQQQMKTLK
ncbi:MAG: outer membrane lipoprotein-sorting protein [Bacteroidales bacterium]|nr:outer membrane lipoprotein-sorting protein [Bacteroidales bacterium]